MTLDEQQSMVQQIMSMTFGQVLNLVHEPTNTPQEEEEERQRQMEAGSKLNAFMKQQGWTLDFAIGRLVLAAQAQLLYKITKNLDAIAEAEHTVKMPPNH